jgi:hypothetical protein
MTHESSPQPVANIPAKPLLSELFKEHLATLGHAHADKNVGANALWLKPAPTAISVPIEVAMRQPATSARVAEGSLVSSGWRNGR